MSEELEKALNFDSLKKAEEMTGESYKTSDFTAMVGLQLAQVNQLKKKELLQKNQDTISYGQQTLGEWKSIVADLGFQLILEETFKNDYDQSVDEKFFVYWNNGILLAADTFRGKSINAAKIYLEWKWDGSNESYYSLSGCSRSPISDTLSGISYDCREGLRHKLSLLKKHGEILEKWSAPQFLWILHYGDTKVTDYDYREINKKRIAKFPKHIQEAICRA